MRAKMGFRPYRHGDLEAFEPRADFAEEWGALGRAFEGFRPRPGCAWTLLRDGEPVGCGGFELAHGGVCWDAWAVLSDLTRREMAHAIRRARKTITWFEGQVLDVPEIEATARADNPEAALALRHLSFVPVHAVSLHPRLPTYTLFRREAA